MTFGTPIESATHNLIGDAATSGGITDGTSGNLVGNSGTGTRDIATVLDPVLADNGGFTMTHKLVVGSPAIDAGSTSFNANAFTPALSNDQRGTGFDRIVKGLATSGSATVDIGAYELFAAPTFTTGMITISVDGEPFDLVAASGASPAGGEFRGTGVAGAIFYPDFLDPGIYPVTYTIEDAFGVTNVAVLLVKVEELPPAPEVTKPRPFPDTKIGQRSREQRITIRNGGGSVVRGLRVVTSGSGRRDFGWGSRS